MSEPASKTPQAKLGRLPKVSQWTGLTTSTPVLVAYYVGRARPQRSTVNGARSRRPCTLLVKDKRGNFGQTAASKAGAPCGVAATPEGVADPGAVGMSVLGL
ncbi:hypothetical protein HPB47_012032 [Ixodes persulcatus]|uniref:Uncharacterized protein n=1 Tax=Ixodes persulcatus TaxID=34615 RepID=A0AC60NUR5_IXOPE|nr:hypothetical protein HPB47_012032 [Ixodes persulcatus]